MSTLVALNTLAMTRPAAGAPALVVADWYERKATVLHLCADECQSLFERTTYETQADQAHAHAAQLMGGGSR